MEHWAKWVNFNNRPKNIFSKIYSDISPENFIEIHQVIQKI